MKGLVKGTSILVFALGLLLVAPVPAHTQPPGFEDESPTVVTDVPAPVPAPIDDWVFVLVAAGILYGVLKAKAYRRNDQNEKTLLHH